MCMTRILLGAVLACLVSGCKSVYSEFDTKTDFSVYRTFAWIDGEAACDTDDVRIEPAMFAYARDRMAAELVRRGLTFTDVASADLIGCLQIQTGMYADPEAGGGEPRRQGTGGLTLASLSDTWMPEDEKSVALEQGTLCLKVWDRKKDVMVWQGWVERVIDLDLIQEAEPESPDGKKAVAPTKTKSVVERAVKALADKLPSMGSR